MAPARGAGRHRHAASNRQIGPRAARDPVVLYGVSVWVGWADGGTERQVRLDTEQVAVRDETPFGFTLLEILVALAVSAFCWSASSQTVRFGLTPGSRLASVGGKTDLEAVDRTLAVDHSRTSRPARRQPAGLDRNDRQFDRRDHARVPGMG